MENKKINICIFGDSITWGAHDSEGGGWANRFKDYFEEKNKDVNVYNLGVSGDDTEDLLKRIEAECKKFKPNLIIFAIGINDSQYLYSQNSYRVALDYFKNNLEELYGMAISYAKVIFIGLTNVDESKIKLNKDKLYNNKNIKRYDNAIKDFCVDKSIKFIVMNGIIKNENLTDGLHPNSEGHRRMFEKIKVEVAEILKNAMGSRSNKSMIGLKKGTVKLVRHNPKWRKSFEHEEKKLWKIFGKDALKIQHIGSTAILGILAKPIIDIVLIAPSLQKAGCYEKKLKEIGYERNKNDTKKERLFFTKGPEKKLTHYLHIGEIKSGYAEDMILFRDYLCGHKDAAKKYSGLKEKLAEKYYGKREIYTAKKEKFIKGIIRKAKKLKTQK